MSNQDEKKVREAIVIRFEEIAVKRVAAAVRLKRFVPKLLLQIEKLTKVTTKEKKVIRTINLIDPIIHRAHKKREFI